MLRTYSKKIILISTVLGLLCFGCDYSPTETNFRRITPPEDGINITVLDPGSINELRGNVIINVKTELNGHTVKYVTGFLDSLQVSLYMSDSSHVVFETGYYPDGDYTFTLILVASSNTGSLADLLGAEGIYSEKQYPVTLFNAPINTPQLEEFSIDNGALTVNWEKYDQLLFKNYTVKRNGNIIAVISDQNQTSYSDTSYFAGYGIYELATDIWNFSTISDQKVYNMTSPEFISASPVPGDKILLTWKKYPFTTSFGKYVITGLTDTADITSVNDTTIIDEFPPLGSGGFYSLTAYSKSGEKTPESGYIQGPPIGEYFELNEAEWLKYIPAKNLIIKLTYSPDTYVSGIACYDGSTLNLLQSQTTNYSTDTKNWGISDDGNYLYYGNNRTVYKINSTTLATEDETDLIDLMPPGNYRNYLPVYSISINNNNILSAIIINRNNLAMLAFFNMNTKNWIKTFQFDYGDYSAGLKISDDQQHIIYGEHVYSYNGIILNEIGRIMTYDAEFTKDYSSIIATYPGRIEILRSTDLQLLQEIQGPYYGTPHIDPETGYFAVNGDIFNPYSGEKLGSVRVNGLRQFYLNGFYFVDSYYKYINLN